MYSEDDLLPLSALQHFVYCPRQAALIHLERVWADSTQTVEGSHLHKSADTGRRESRRPVKTLRSMPLRSLVHGLSGKADVMELHEAPTSDCGTMMLEDRFWRIRLVEYKRGKPKKHREDAVQLCAQALCVEEMLGVRLTEGDLYYGTTRRRTTIEFDDALRTLTISVASRMHALFASRVTPPAEPGPKCRNCSLREICRPYAWDRSAARYVKALFRSSGERA